MIHFADPPAAPEPDAATLGAAEPAPAARLAVERLRATYGGAGGAGARAAVDDVTLAFPDRRVTAVVGTHTHVPTADARVLPGGTAYITDVGMTGPRGGVIGVKREQAIESLRTHMKIRYETAEEDPWLMGVLVELGSRPLRAASISPLLVPWDGAQAGAPGSP